MDAAINYLVFAVITVVASAFLYVVGKSLRDALSKLSTTQKTHGLVAITALAVAASIYVSMVLLVLSILLFIGKHLAGGGF